MAAALTLPENVNVGESFVVTGTGFANTTAYTVTVNARGNADVLFGNTTSGGGAVDTTSKLTITPSKAGLIHVTVSDGTSSVTGTIKVWRT